MCLIGTPAPPFVAPSVSENNKIQDFKSEDYKGKWLVLFFYPLDFTIVCPTEITQFRDSLPEFKKRNATVAGVSIDSVYAHKKWIDTELGNLGFALISDLKKEISRDYDCFLEAAGISTRATYIIDPKGLIQYASFNNTSVGRDTSEILRVLDALQTGEMCAAGWKKGDKTLKV